MNKDNAGRETPEDPKKRRVTMRDMAKELGVSHVTVSRALRNSPEISERTKLRIKQKAEEMEYSPDPMLSALSTYRLSNQEKPVRATLAWINLFEDPDQLRKYKVFDQYWQGASDTATQLGYHLEEFRWADLPAHRIDSILKARGIRGILLSPSSYSDEYLHTKLEAFPWKNYATVRFGQSASSLKVTFISSAQVSNTITAFEQVSSKGYKRIGFAGEFLRKLLFNAGYLWAQQTIPAEQRLPPDLLPEYRSHSATEKETGRLDYENQPRCHHLRHLTQFGMPNMLQELGYRVPEDIALCTLSINDTTINAGIDQNPHEIGRAAILTLVSQLKGNNFGILPFQRETLVEGLWVDGPMLPERM